MLPSVSLALAQPASLASLEGQAFLAASVSLALAHPDFLASLEQQAFLAASVFLALAHPDFPASLEEQAFLDASVSLALAHPDFLASLEQQAFLHASASLALQHPDFLASLEEQTFLHASEPLALQHPDFLASLEEQTLLHASEPLALQHPDFLASLAALEEQAFLHASASLALQHPDFSLALAGAFPLGLTALGFSEARDRALESSMIPATRLAVLQLMLEFLRISLSIGVEAGSYLPIHKRQPPVGGVYSRKLNGGPPSRPRCTHEIARSDLALVHTGATAVSGGRVQSGDEASSSLSLRRRSEGENGLLKAMSALSVLMADSDSLSR